MRTQVVFREQVCADEEKRQKAKIAACAQGTGARSRKEQIQGEGNDIEEGTSTYPLPERGGGSGDNGNSVELKDDSAEGTVGISTSSSTTSRTEKDLAAAAVEEEEDGSCAAWFALFKLNLSLVFALSTWFSATAVISQLKVEYNINDTEAGVLTSTVNMGFVVGALAMAILNVADLFGSQKLICTGGLGAAAANLLIVVPIGYGGTVAMRFITGFFLAAVYPPSLKLISTWFKARRGLALGSAIGALGLGSALPHLINGSGGVGNQWFVIIATSVLSAIAGLIVLCLVATGPFKFSKTKFSLRLMGRICSNRGLQLVLMGYSGHMWELYALWSWFKVLYEDYLMKLKDVDDDDNAQISERASLVTFGVIGSGIVGCVALGILSDNIGRCNSCILAMLISGSCAVIYGPLAFEVEAGQAVLIPLSILWGAATIAESAQFSAIVTEVADQDSVGTALTAQLAVGFSLTIFVILIIPVIEPAISWTWVTVLLAPGPYLGACSMYLLKRLIEHEGTSTSPVRKGKTVTVQQPSLDYLPSQMKGSAPAQ